uniref:Uncharacterized protein n=1 Tax=Tanacetum cinerariifolium TaxID=118510 RepID=A0A6L2MIH5_TANCI|nr:hypothetical protein [Tanacetum cinerariifolium]
MHTAHDDSKLETIRFVFRHEAAQIYDAILPKAMTNQVMLDYVAYKTYYAIASGAEPPKLKKPKTKSNSAISFEETTSKKKPTKAKKDVPSKKKPTSKPKLTKKKAQVKADRGKGLDVFSKVALSEAAQLKVATKQSKKDFHISQASGSGDGTDFELGVPDEQHRKTSGADEGTGTKLRVPDVPKYDSENDKESWGDSEEEDDDDNNDDNNGDDNDANDDDNQEDDDKNNDEEETNKEKIDDEENIDEEEADEVTKELYKDVNVNLGNKDAEITNADQGGADQQNILPQAVSDFENPMIEKNVTESLDAAVLARSSSQLKSTYVAAASLSEFGLTKILIDKMEKNKSYDKANYKRELYDALVKSYQTDKDLFDTYGEVFTLKRSRDKDQDPSARSDRGTLMIMKKYDYGHLEETEVPQGDQKRYTFQEDHQRVIYIHQMNRNRLMCTDELHKSGDGTLDFVWTALHDIASEIRMGYLPKKN